MASEITDSTYRQINKIYPIGFTPSVSSGTVGHDVTHYMGGLVQVQQRCFAQPSSISILNNQWWWPDQNNNNTLLSFTCRIYPTSSTNKILVHIRWVGEWAGQSDNTMAISRRRNNDWSTHTLLTRNSTVQSDGNRPACIAPVISSHSATNPAGTDSATTPESCNIWYLDTTFGVTGPNYVEYGPAFRNGTSNRTVYINRTLSDNNASGRERMISNITLYEFSS